MNEEEKAIEWLKDKAHDFSINSKDLHYFKILYSLIIKLIGGDNE